MPRRSKYKLPSDKKQHDDEIARRALNLLEWDVEVLHEQIGVRVEHGIVTLTGEVDWNFQKEAAERDVRQLTGVSGVVELNSDQVSRLGADIHQKIEEALRRNAELEASGIIVGVEGDGSRFEAR